MVRRHILDIFKRRLARDGQVIRIGVAVLLHQAYQLQQRRVGIVVGKELRDVDGEVIAFLVAHKHTTVTVENAAARGGDGAILLGDTLTGGVVLFALDDLHFI